MLRIYQFALLFVLVDSTPNNHQGERLTKMCDSPFPKRLKEARLKAGISQKKLGIAAGLKESVASSQMNHYEKGKHNPSFKVLARIAKVLNVPTSFFYEVDDSMAKKILNM
jgi:transcriptional regulator with XRE-family HTH domain